MSPGIHFVTIVKFEVPYIYEFAMDSYKTLYTPVFIKFSMINQVVLLFFCLNEQKKSKKCDIGEKVVGTLNIPVRASLFQEHHLHPVLIRFKFILQTLSFIRLSPLFLSGLPQW